LGAKAAQKKYGQSYVNWQFYEKLYLSPQKLQNSITSFLQIAEDSRIKKRRYLSNCVYDLEKKERDEQWKKIESPKIERQIKQARDDFQQQKKTEADERKKVTDDPEQIRVKKEHIALVDTLKSYMDAPWYLTWTVYWPAICWYTIRCRAKQKEQRI
jgi:hypothetical protein